MTRGPRKHLKRLHAPKSWMLDKLGGTWAPRPSTGPHKLRESIPLVLILRNRLHYALTRTEVIKILKRRLIKIDGKVRTDDTYPLGFMDVVKIEKTNQNYRILYDVRGRFKVHRISKEESEFKLCRVKKVFLASRGTPCLVTHDGRTITYPNPSVHKHDSIKYSIKTGDILEVFPFAVGNVAMIIGGKSSGRIGKIVGIDAHPAIDDLITLRDVEGNSFSATKKYVFVIGKEDPVISLPKYSGVRPGLVIKDVGDESEDENSESKDGEEEEEEEENAE